MVAKSQSPISMRLIEKAVSEYSYELKKILLDLQNKKQVSSLLNNAIRRVWKK